MRCTSITLFLASTLINIHTRSSEACPALKTSDEVTWIRASSPIHLQAKGSGYYYDYDPAVPYASPKDRIRRERELVQKIRRDYSHVDEGTKLRIIDLEKQLGEEIRRIGEGFEPKPPKEKSFKLFLRKLGPQKSGRRRRKRKWNVHELDPKPPRVFVRVHKPAETAPSDGDDSPPPIVYAPPVPEENYPPPGKPQASPGKPVPSRVLPMAQSSSSQETNVSTTTDDSDYQNQPTYRRKKRARFRKNWDDEPVRRVQVLFRGGPLSESKNDSEDERKSDSSDEDEVRQVHLMRDFLPPPKARRRRPTVARTNVDAPHPIKKRQSSGPVPVVM